jgi:hypothetical protein
MGVVVTLHDGKGGKDRRSLLTLGVDIRLAVFLPTSNAVYGTSVCINLAPTGTALGERPFGAVDLKTAAKSNDDLYGTVPIRKVVRSGCLNCAPLSSLHQFVP